MSSQSLTQSLAGSCATQQEVSFDVEPSWLVCSMVQEEVRGGQPQVTDRDIHGGSCVVLQFVGLGAGVQSRSVPVVEESRGNSSWTPQLSQSTRIFAP